MNDGAARGPGCCGTGFISWMMEWRLFFFAFFLESELPSVFSMFAFFCFYDLLLNFFKF